MGYLEEKLARLQGLDDARKNTIYSDIIINFLHDAGYTITEDSLEESYFHIVAARGIIEDKKPRFQKLDLTIDLDKITDVHHILPVLGMMFDNAIVREAHYSSL